MQHVEWCRRNGESVFMQRDMQVHSGGAVCQSCQLSRATDCNREATLKGGAQSP